MPTKKMLCFRDDLDRRLIFFFFFTLITSALNDLMTYYYILFYTIVLFIFYLHRDENISLKHNKIIYGYNFRFL